jgi:hypothetical protein
MLLEQSIAKLLIGRLDHHGVEILRSNRGDLRFFTPPDKYHHLHAARTDYVRGQAEGAIRELQLLIRSSPHLMQAVLDQISCSAD